MDKHRLDQAMVRIQQGTADERDFAIYHSFCEAKQRGKRPLHEDAVSAKTELIYARITDRLEARRRRRLYVIWGRVVACLLAFLLVALWMTDGKKKGEETPMAQIESILPGKSAGVLITADGEKVDLEQVRTGMVSDLAGVRISKTEDGVLRYETTDVQAGAPVIERENRLITDRGQQYQLMLPDGTQVWLNAASILRFPSSFDGQDRREVSLEGEAYFEVAKQENKPFVVVTNDQRIRVFGTHFNVNSYPDEATTKTTLLEGSVGINDVLVLKPGDQAETDRNGHSQITRVNTAHAVAWRDGFFEFQDENIFQIMRKLSRWYDVDVVYSDGVPTETMQGTISKFEDISKVLGVISQTDLVKFTVKDRKIVVSKK